MARKTKAEAEKTRQLLLDAALKLFSENGVAKTTLAQIASACGMTRGAIYWHFEDKAAMLHALFERSISPEMERLWRSITDEGADPLECLLKASRSFWHELTRESNMRQVMMLYRQAEMVPELSESLDELHCQEDSHMQQALQMAHDQGKLHPGMSVSTAFLLFNAMHDGLTRLICSPRQCMQGVDLDALLDELIDGVGRAVRAPEAQ
ncbi:TetR family transcriptional regulator [Ferrimonas kyonanensis]|uniref:TetR family transcriptional regulator n=1 Tax=Ferrimonas kyonanensis TaxID=364763 RepID=UPI00041224D7|nr:TetR family transcriptional regulator [Ferrimonas kyonanensis]